MVTRLLPLVLLLTGCLEVGGARWRIDVPGKVAHLTLTGLASSSVTEAGTDLASVVTEYVEGRALIERYPAATLTKPVLRGEGAQLVLDVDLRWSLVTDLHLRDWDTERPFRFCPDAGYFIVTTNADFRDPDGRAVWAKERSLLEVVTDDGRPDGASLLAAFQAWEGEGRPDLKAFSERWAGSHSQNGEGGGAP